MDIEQLKRLSKNPHYKLSVKQKQILSDYEAEQNRKPMVEFGTPPIHDNTFETTKRKRTNKRKSDTIKIDE